LDVRSLFQLAWGTTLIRVDPAIHRSLAQLAEARSTSINNLAAEALANLAGATKPTVSKRRK
jgi:predicted HicB family RNase H-like nuclease